MRLVYLLEHVHVFDEDNQDVKTIGIYETEQLAQEAIERISKQPGFREAPDGFVISAHELNQDSWDEGYCTVGCEE